jgi:hypothetical protein
MYTRESCVPAFLESAALLPEDQLRRKSVELREPFNRNVPALVEDSLSLSKTE